MRDGPRRVCPAFPQQPNLFTATGSLRRSLRAGIAFADAGRLTAELAQVVELGTADASSFDHVDVINDCCMQRKDALDADSERRLADRDRFSHALSTACDDDPFKSLQSLFVFAFLDANVDADGVTGNKIRNIAFQLCLINMVQSVHCKSPQRSLFFIIIPIDISIYLIQPPSLF